MGVSFMVTEEKKNIKIRNIFMNMKKFLFIFMSLLFVCNVFSNDIENLNAYESAPGIITFTWDSDTANINKFIFSVCKFDETKTVVKKFVNLFNQDAANFINNDGYFTCSSDTIILHGNKVNTNANIYDECVNTDGTLKAGHYVVNIIGIHKNGTYNREFHSNEINVIGKNCATDHIENIIIGNNIKKYLSKNQIYISRNGVIYDIYGRKL